MPGPASPASPSTPDLQNYGGNSYQRVVNQQMVSPVTSFPGTGSSHSLTVAQVPQLSEHMDLDPVTVADQPSALGPALISGSGNDSDEGINNGGAGAHSVVSPSMEDKEHTPVAQAPTSAGAASSAPQTVYPSPATSNKSLVTGGKAKKPRRKAEGTNADPKPYKRKVCTEACTPCRTSKIKCAFDKDPNTCLGCLKKRLNCDRGLTTDNRTRKAYQKNFRATVDGCKKYLADFLLLIYIINARKQREGQSWPDRKLTALGKHLSTGRPNLSMSADLLTDETWTLPPQWVETAEAHVRLDALAGLQLDLQGIEDNLAEMRKRLHLCVEGTRERVRTLARYLHVLINDGGHYMDAKTSLANVFKSRAPFSQIDNDMSGQFSSISDDADTSDLVKSLVGHVDLGVSKEPRETERDEGYKGCKGHKGRRETERDGESQG